MGIAASIGGGYSIGSIYPTIPYHPLPDALHRQIGIHTEKRLLKRKNEQTLREGHAHGHARHASEPAGGFGAADR